MIPSGQSQHCFSIFRPRIYQMVDSQTNKGNAQAKHQPIAYPIFVRQGFQNKLPQIIGTNHGANDDHEQGENNGLVNAQHDVGEGKWHFDLEQSLQTSDARH